MHARSYLLLLQGRATSLRSSISSSESMVSTMVLSHLSRLSQQAWSVVWLIDQLHAISSVRIVLLIVRVANSQCHYQKVCPG